VRADASAIANVVCADEAVVLCVTDSAVGSIGVPLCGCCGTTSFAIVVGIVCIVRNAFVFDEAPTSVQSLDTFPSAIASVGCAGESVVGAGESCWTIRIVGFGTSVDTGSAFVGRVLCSFGYACSADETVRGDWVSAKSRAVAEVARARKRVVSAASSTWPIGVDGCGACGDAFFAIVARVQSPRGNAVSTDETTCL